MRFAIFGNTFEPSKSAPAERLFAILHQYNAQIVVYKEFYEFLGLHDLTPEVDGLIESSDFTADMVICIGGDGTFLDAASKIGAKEIPILGINTGRLGFLAEITADEMEDTFAEIYQGKHHVENRNLLELSIDGVQFSECPFALNEIAVLKTDISSMIAIHTTVNGEYLTTYQSDGLIISTPTGSTAYSLSVGGPIMVPQTNVIAITPIAPHSLNVRPILIPEEWKITLQVESRSSTYLIGIDGRTLHCNQGAPLTIKRANFCAKLVKRANHNFFCILRDKMMWGADSRK